MAKPNESACRLYEIQMTRFAGLGWHDLAYDRRGGVYETLGLAYAVYTTGLLDLPPDPRVLASLLARQDPQTGGFHTYFTADQPRLADPNVEITSVALLALHVSSH